MNYWPCYAKTDLRHLLWPLLLLLALACNGEPKGPPHYELVWQMRFAKKPALDLRSWKFYRRQYTDYFANNQNYLARRRNAALLHDEMYSVYPLHRDQSLNIGKLGPGKYQFEAHLVARSRKQGALSLCHGRSSCQQFNSATRFERLRFDFTLQQEEQVKLVSHLDQLLIGSGRLYKEVRTPKKPNIIFILSDTQRHDSLSIENPDAVTPNLDRLARKGVYFKRPYTPANWTRPALTTMFNGRFNYQLGINNLFFEISERQRALYSQRANPLPVRAGRAGLSSFAVIDNIFALEYTNLGLDQGFENLHNISRDYYQAEPITQQAERVISENKNRRFFLFVHHNSAHHVYKPPAEYLQKIPRTTRKFSNDPDWRKYLASVSFIDYHVGRLLAKLKEHQLDQNTIIVFTSDHGELFDPRHNRAFYHIYSGIHSHGETLYNEELLVPLIIYNPLEPLNGQQIGQPVQLKAIFHYFVNNFDSNYEIADWLDEFNQTPFFIEGRMQHAWVDANHKMIVHAPGYNRLREGYYGQKRTIKRQYIDLQKDPAELNILFNEQVKPKEAFVTAQRKFSNSLPSYSMFLPREQAISLRSSFGFSEFSADCNLQTDFGRMPEYRPRLERLIVKNTSGKDCRVRFTPYPLYEGFSARTLRRALPLQVGPLAQQIRSIPVTLNSAFWSALYADKDPINLDKTLPAFWANTPWPDSRNASSYQVTAEVKSILKSWGYIQ